MIGPGIIGGVSQHEALLRRWQPAVVGPVIDPAIGAGSLLRTWCPDAFLVARVYEADGLIANRIELDPLAAARWAVYEYVLPVADRLNRDFDLWQFNNEVSHTSVADLQRLADFSVEYAELLRREGARGAIGCFSVGTPEAPELDGGAQWRTFTPAMIECRPLGAVLLLHAYGAPSIWGPEPSWYLQRYERRVRPRLPADLQDYPYLYGEFGSDMGVLGQAHARQGWRTGYAGDAVRYVADLRLAADLLADTPGCLGAGLFALCPGSGDWADFDISGRCADLLADMPWPAPQPDPQPQPDRVWTALKAAFPDAVDLRATLPVGSGQYETRPLAVIEGVVLHHTGLASEHSWPGTATYHVVGPPAGRGYPGISYHIGIGPHGQVAYLGDLRTVRWHAKGQNDRTIGIACMGNYEQQEPTAPMLTALQRLFGVLGDVLGKVIGFNYHRELADTLCPGGNLIAAIEGENPPVDLGATWADVFADLDALHEDVGRLAQHLGQPPRTGALPPTTGALPRETFMTGG